MTKRLSARIAFRCKPVERKELEDFADMEDVDFSDFMREIANRALKYYRKKHGTKKLRSMPEEVAND